MYLYFISDDLVHNNLQGLGWRKTMVDRNPGILFTCSYLSELKGLCGEGKEGGRKKVREYKKPNLFSLFVSHTLFFVVMPSLLTEDDE